MLSFIERAQLCVCVCTSVHTRLHASRTPARGCILRRARLDRPLRAAPPPAGGGRLGPDSERLRFLNVTRRSRAFGLPGFGSSSEQKWKFVGLGSGRRVYRHAVTQAQKAAEPRTVPQPKSPRRAGGQESYSVLQDLTRTTKASFLRCAPSRQSGRAWLS